MTKEVKSCYVLDEDYSKPVLIKDVWYYLSLGFYKRYRKMSVTARISSNETMQSFSVSISMTCTLEKNEWRIIGDEETSRILNTPEFGDSGNLGDLSEYSGG